MNDTIRLARESHGLALAKQVREWLQEQPMLMGAKENALKAISDVEGAIKNGLMRNHA